MIEVNIDGLTEPVNPGGIATYGVVITDKINEFQAEFHGVVGEGPGMSNNVAEYVALYHALERLIEMGISSTEPRAITIKSDSQLVVNQMMCKWACHGGLYVGMMNAAKELLKQFRNPINFQWIPREQNVRADALSRQAYEDYCKSKGIPVKYMKDTSFVQTENDSIGSGMSKATREIIETHSFDETRAVLESMRKQQPKDDIVIQDEMPKITGEGSKIIKEQMPNYPDLVKYYETPSKQIMQQIKTIETCKQCKWIHYSGPHVGCYPDGKYRKWLPKSFAENNKCELFKPRDQP